MAVALWRLLAWTVRRLGPRRLLVFGLLLVAVGSSALGVASVVREVDQGLVLVIAAAALLIGWGVAASPLPGWAGGSLVSALGLAAVVLQVGGLGGPVVSAVRALAGLGWGLIEWSLGGPPPSGTMAGLAVWRLERGAAVLVSRVRDWAAALAVGEPAFDPVAAALVWSLVVWLVSGWAGWIVQRRDRALLAILPAGVLLGAVLAYAGMETRFLLLLLATFLLLLAVVRYDSRIRRWQASGTDFADLRFETVVVILSLTAMLVGLAAVTPTISFRRIVDSVRRWTEGPSEGMGELAESLGVDRRPRPATTLDEVRSVGLPRSHLLTGGVELSEEMVMEVSTGELPPGSPDVVLRGGPAPRYYWRSRTYDVYTGRGWVASETETLAYEAGQPVITTTLETQRRLRQEVRVVGDTGGLLHAAGVLMAVDHDYKVAWRSEEDIFGATTEARSYRADSLVNEVTVAGLRSAGSDYPQWVRDRYLGLPEALPGRVTSLARDLTATEPTPYDRAAAIERHLRAISYTLDVPLPPGDRDVVDYFLFDLQKGYCDYYATAMVVLARAAGVPARLAVGYASGSYDAYIASYVVTEANAHAWVEVYFPEYGWVSFEPTAGLPGIERPDQEGAGVEWPEPQGALEPARVWWNVFGWPWWVWVGGVVLLAIVFGVGWPLVDGWRLRRMQPAAAAGVLYGRLRRQGRRLAVPMGAGDTPHEFGSSLADWLRGRMGEGRWAGLLRPAQQEARRLIELYVRASYSAREPGGDEQAGAVRSWWRLRWRLWLARLRGED